MTCEKPRDCSDNSRIVQALPPLEAGESEVATTMAAPAFAGAPSPAAASPAAASSLLSSASSIVHGAASTVRVNITTMKEDRTLHSRVVDLAVASEDAQPAAFMSWTRVLTSVDGKFTESEASCVSGHFRCDGDAAWCSQQRTSSTCVGSNARRVQRSGKHSQLRA